MSATSCPPGVIVIPLKRVDHLSMAHANWREQSARLDRLLGFKFLHSWEAHEGSDFTGSVSQVRGTGIEFEVISPAGPKSFVQRFLDEQGPGLHHIAVEVHDLDETCAELERLGITPLGGIQDDGLWKLTYIHPKDSGGILWQLFVPYGFPEEADRNAGGGLVDLQRVDHVSMAVPGLARQVEWQQRVFGGELEGQWEEPRLQYQGAVLTIPGSLLKFEIIAPTSPESFVQRFIDEKRAGMHHICCEVASVDAAVEALRGAGIEPHGGVIESDWRRHAFLHPRDSGGVLFQLVEERAEE